MDEWYNSLPHYLRNDDPNEFEWISLSRNRLMWRYWNLRILLYRPILLRWAIERWRRNRPGRPGPQASDSSDADEDPAERKCRFLCLQNARATISSISEYMERHICTRLAAWYILYFLFQAVLIPIIFLMADPTSADAGSWYLDVETTKSLLTHPSLINNRLATRCLEVINRLLCGPNSSHEPGDGPATQGPGGSSGNTQQHQHQQQQFLMMQQESSEHLFNDATLSGLFQTEFGDMAGPAPDGSSSSAARINFSEWLDFAGQGGFRHPSNTPF